MHTPTKLTRVFIAALACLTCINAYGVNIKLKVENLSDTGGLWFTPVFLGFHNGALDTFDPGLPASTAIKALAEGGDTSALEGIAATVPGAISTTLVQDPAAMGPPGVLFQPGSSNSTTVNLNAAMNRYLSFASMLLPSNDAFFANANPTSHALFDINGNFNTGFEILILGMNIWDAGSEKNDGLGVPLLNFDPMNDMSTDTDENIQSHLSLSSMNYPGLGNFDGVTLATGDSFSGPFSAYTEIARITAYEVPNSVPDTTPYIGVLSGLALLGFQLVVRKRTRA